jgi:hypothetical protein
MSSFAVTPGQPTIPSALERVTALSRRQAITSVSPWPTGASSATTLFSGTNQQTVISNAAGPGANFSGAASAAAAASEPPLAIQERAAMQTPSGFIATAPLNGLADGSYLTVHSTGTIMAMTPGGDIIWSRPALDFTERTGRYPYPPPDWPPITASLPVMPIGLDPLDPSVEAGAHSFAVGDLTGDGVDDVAAAHFFYPTICIDGNGGTLVSVMDGRSGAFIWSRMYPGYVNELAIADRTLVVASETGDFRPNLGENGSVSTLDAWSFQGPADNIQTQLAWSLSTGAQWARWLALEIVPGGRIAAAWTNSPLGTVGNLGHVLIAWASNGATAWSSTTSGYPRFLRWDASRNRLVAVEEGDPSSGVNSYSIISRNISDGSVATTVTANSAVVLSIQVGDLDGDGNAEWVVGDVTSVPLINALGRVQALDGGNGAQKWMQLRGVEPQTGAEAAIGVKVPHPYGLLLVPKAVGADVLVGSLMPGLFDTELELLGGGGGLLGADAVVLASKRDTNLLHPRFLSLYQSNGEWLVRAASSRPQLYGSFVQYLVDATGATVALRPTTPYQVIKSFKVATGEEVSATRLLGRIQGVAGTKVNGDATTDLVVGGESGAVFALDGNKVDDHPIIIWRRTVAGPVHQIIAADLDGDGHDELIVAATHAVDVLEATTGALRYEIPYPTEFVWDVTVADINGDGSLEVMVPAATLTAYSGSNGSLFWRYTPTEVGKLAFSNVALTPEHRVVAQYAVLPLTSDNGAYEPGVGDRGRVSIDGATGNVVWSNLANQAVPQLWHGTVAGRLDSVAASVVAFTWLDSSSGTRVLRLDLHDAESGTLLATTTTAWLFNPGVFLAPARGAVAFGWPTSMLVNPTESSPVLANRFAMDMANGTFGALGTRLLLARFSGGDAVVLGENGLDPTPGPSGIAPIASHLSRRVEVNRMILQDLDHDGSDEIMEVPFDWDGYSLLVTTSQGGAYNQTLQSGGIQILDLQPPPVPLNAVVSRKVHGSAGTFDVDLPLTGITGIECRSGGANGDYTLVFTFANPLTSVASASVSSGTGSVSSSAIGSDAHQYLVNLTGVINAEVITVSLTNVNDSAGNSSSLLSASMGVLVGDVNANKVVSNTDVPAVKSQVAAPVTSSNFRSDVNANGIVSNTDVSATKAQVGASLP